jgi:hypothetical protein
MIDSWSQIWMVFFNTCTGRNGNIQNESTISLDWNWENIFVHEEIENPLNIYIYIYITRKLIWTEFGFFSIFEVFHLTCERIAFKFWECV